MRAPLAAWLGVLLIGLAGCGGAPDGTSVAVATATPDGGAPSAAIPSSPLPPAPTGSWLPTRALPGSGRTRGYLPRIARNQSDGDTGACDGLVQRNGSNLVLDGAPVFFFGLNAPFLLAPEFPEPEVEPLLAELARRGVNTLRVWYFAHHDAERFERLLGVGQRLGLRFVVTLADNVFQGRDWFFGHEDEQIYRPHLERTVSRFKDRPEILFWEVINEPSCGEGKYDAECLEAIDDWLALATSMVKAIDGCHLVSTGMIGVGNYPADVEHYRRVHNRPEVEIVSVHRWRSDEGDEELRIARELERPIFFGEVYEKAYDDGCGPLRGKDAPRHRAERIVEDLEDAIESGVDGYLLWDFAAGHFTLTDGSERDYCSSFGYPLDDPLWPALAQAGLPPAVPWR